MRSTLFISVAIVAAAWIIRSRDEPRRSVEPAIVAAFDTIEIPVPVQFVPAGTKISDVTFKSVAFPKHQVPNGALRTLVPYVEAVTIAPLPANLPLFKDNLSLSASTINPVLDRIPAGMRAMTIKVDATSAVEGWAGSGSVVDVLLIEKDRTNVIAEKVKILSAERSVVPVEGNSAPNVPSTVTLLVTQEQCLAINTAIPLGRIAFALRSMKDDEVWRDAQYTAERLQRNGRSEKRSVVTGYVSLTDRSSGEAYALADGKWIKTEVVPEGFLPSKER